MQVTRLKEVVDSALIQMKQLLSLQFSSRDFVSLTVLLECLTDAKEDAFVRQKLDALIDPRPAEASQATPQMALNQLLNMRRCLLDSIIAILPAHNSEGDDPYLQTSFTSCFIMGLYLTVVLPKLRIATRSSQRDEVHRRQTAAGHSFALYLPF